MEAEHRGGVLGPGDGGTGIVDQTAGHAQMGHQLPLTHTEDQVFPPPVQILKARPREQPLKFRDASVLHNPLG